MAQDTLTPGTFAGRYSIERELGRGATAHVYLARDQRHGTPVAIKLLRLDVSQTIGTDRFLKEIRMSAGLHHPHILPVLDSGEHDGQLYFVLPHADGGSLRDRLLAERQLPVAEALAITRTLAAALDHAHAKGIVHRDVKPENILFSGSQACLADFGIARALDHSTSESTTSTGIVRGTPAYMSPEQASGETTIDGRSDLFSFACVVYEMFSGMRPFDGPTAQSMIAMRLTETARSVRAYRPSLPPAVDDVFRCALSVSPADRYQSGAELASALEAAIVAPLATAPARRWSTRTTALVVLALLGVAGGAAAYLGGLGSESTGEIPEGDPRRVAVMYLDNLTPATLPLHVADGITEDLIDQLGGVRALLVTSTYGVRTFRGGAIGVDSIRRALKVGTIVTGSVARAGDSVRLNIRLMEAATGQHLASVPLVAAWHDLSALRSNLAERVAFTLRQRIGDRVALQRVRATTSSAVAWEMAQRASALVARGLESWNLPLFIEADSLYARAAAIDPAWDRPWIKRGSIALTLGERARRPTPGADSVAFASMSLSDRREAWYTIATALADSALRRVRSAQALSLRGEARYRISRQQPKGDSMLALAERDLRDALEIRPDAAPAWTTLASITLAQQRFADAAEAAKRGYDADPFFESRPTLSKAFFTALYAERPGDARRWCELGLSHYPSDPRFVECELTWLGWFGRSAGELRRAEQLVMDIERADSLNLVADTRAYRRLMVAAVAARSGSSASARRLLAAIGAARRDTISQNTAIGESYVYLLLADRDTSLAILRRFLTAVPEMRTDVAYHPWFTQLRGDARFSALVGTR